MRFTSLAEWLAWQASLHPESIELGLERVASVWRRMRPTGLQTTVITVAGTNGKGSCVALLESIYRSAGYTTGSYTSPHLICYNERVRLNGAPMSDQRLCQAFERVDQARQGISLTYFEFGTLAALEIFAESQPQVVILEVGLGGRLDAVNIIDPDLALITTVDIDHTAWLGEEREQIGREKAGIMRAGIPVVLADADMPASVVQHGEALGARLFQLGSAFRASPCGQGWDWFGLDQVERDLPLPALTGAFQRSNAAAVISAVKLLEARLPVGRSALETGLSGVRLQGRMQLVAGSPPVLLDVAHNLQAAAALKQHIEALGIKGEVRAVFGMLADKDAAGVIALLQPLVDRWCIVATDESGRARQTGELGALFRRSAVESSVEPHESVAAALQAASAGLGADDLVVVFGSFQIVGDALHRLGQE